MRLEQKVLDLQHQDRKTFEEVRKLHRDLLINPVDQIDFDANACEIRQKIRRDHATNRAICKRQKNLLPQIQYSDELAINNYFVCIIKPCPLCPQMSEESLEGLTQAM